MASRRALIIAPLYDGKWLPPLPGRSLLVEQLTKCLKRDGGYDVEALDNIVEDDSFRAKLEKFFDTDGELLFYFYGHGCLNGTRFGVFATSSARPNKEGVLMMEVTHAANQSSAREVVMIFDCCHAGAAVPATKSAIEFSTSGLGVGRDILAGCAAHQEGWVTKDKDRKFLGAFSSHILEGLEGAARPRGSDRVRGSVLGAYVTETFQSWGQDPVVQTNEAGAKLCIITSNISEEAEAQGRSAKGQKPQIIGVPFKPAQLFVGRSAELDFLLTMLIDGSKPVAVSATVEGLGGIGKTELVLQLIYEPDVLAVYKTIVWLDGAGPLPPQWEKVAEQLGISKPPKTPEALVNRIEQELKGRGNTLLILDNASDWHSVKDFIPASLPLLVTTRTRDFGGNNFRHTELGFLTDEAAANFLIQMVPGLKADPSLQQLVQSLEGHALAIELAGWNIKYQGLNANQYMERFNKHQSDPPVVVSATKHGRTVDACLALTWNALQLDASRALWRSASLFAPTSAHRDLLRVSFIGDEDTRREMEYLMRESRYRRGEDPNSLDLSLRDAVVFDNAYAELRAMHVLSRVEGSTGERWAMHRLVRDYGRARTQNTEIMMHAMAFSEWLRHPTLPLGPEIPHFVVAVMDSAKYVGEFQGARGSRNISSEVWNRSVPRLLDSKYFIRFIKDELRDPKAITLILSGLKDINEDVRKQAIRLLENVGPIPEVLEGLAASLDDEDPQVRALAGQSLAKYGGQKTIAILLAAAQGPNQRSRMAAIRALGLMGAKAQQGLIKALKSDDRAVRFEAALLLCEAGRAEGGAHVTEQLQLSSGTDQKLIVPTDNSLMEQHELLAVHQAALTPELRTRAIRALGKVKTPGLASLLFELLEDPDTGVKAAAADTIAKLKIPGGSKRIIDELIRIPMNSLTSGKYDEFISSALKVAIKERTSLPPNLVAKLLKDYSYKTQCVELLRKTKSVEAVPLLIKALKDETYYYSSSELLSTYYSDVVPSITSSLVGMGKEAVPELTKALSAKTAEIRQGAAFILGLIAEAQPSARLAELARKDSNAEVRMMAAAALFIINYEVLEKLEDKIMDRIVEVASENSNVDVRQAAAVALIMLHHDHGKEIKKGQGCPIRELITKQNNKEGMAFLDDLEPSVFVKGKEKTEKGEKKRFVKAYKLTHEMRNVGGESSFDKFLKTLGAASNETQAFNLYLELSLRILAKYKIAAPIETIVNLAETGKPLTQESCSLALGVLKSKWGVPVLLEKMKSKKPEIRRAAVKALGSIGDESALPHLSKMVKGDSNDEVRLKASEAITSIQRSRK